MEGSLPTAQKRAWVTFFVAHGVLSKKINRALEAAACVSLEIYDVLLVLEHAEGRRMRMSDLAERVLFSRSGVTRLVDRLEAQGLIERVRCPQDRRACHALLTDAGLAERERAWPVYREAIAEHFAVHLNDEEAETMARCFRRMIDEPPVGFDDCTGQ